ncbi:MAG: hypothetical protein MK209_05495 [Planctomycetes bacterium]|nr:hypothetical protein [Planctomycetota bacterium]
MPFVRTFRFAGYSFALTIVLAGLADAAGSALGGSQADVLLASCIVALGFGVGMARPGLFASLHLASAATLGLAAWILPTTPRLAAACLMLGLIMPLVIVGRRFGQALTGLGPSGAALPIGFFFGLIAAGFGTGPWLYALMIFGILWPPPAAVIQDEKIQVTPITDRVALVAISIAAGMLWIAMRPMTTVFDSESVLQDTRRAVAIGAAFALGWWTLGASIADGKKVRWVGGSLLACAAAIGFRRTALTTDRLATPSEFAPLVGSDKLLNLLDRNDRLTEIDDLYVPWLTLVLAAFPVIALSAALRASAGIDNKDGRWPIQLGLLLISASIGVMVSSLALLPQFADSFPAITFATLLIAAGTLALGAGRMISGPICAAIVIGLWFAIGPPNTPGTGRPFYDLYNYKVARNNDGVNAQHTTSSAYVRVIERDTPSLDGSYQLYDGRNQLTPNADESLGWEVDALFPLLFAQNDPKRSLLVGVPHAGTVAALREAGANEVHLAVDPPELASLAWGFTPEWTGMRFDSLTSTASRAKGQFDFILLRESGLWDPQRARTLRSAALRQTAAKIKPGGLIAVVLDPRRAVPGLTRSVADRLSSAVGNPAKVYVVPHSFFTPSIVIVAQRTNKETQDTVSDNALRLRVHAQLRDRGLPLSPISDIDLLRADIEHDESELFADLLAGPLPPIALALSATAPFRAEEVRPSKRASSVLGRLGQKGSLTWALGLHEGCQVYSLKDTQVVPREEKIDLNKNVLDDLLALCRQYPESQILRFLAESFGYSAVRKREVEWAHDFLAPLVEDLNWQTPWILVAYGETLYEMLEPEKAERLADKALAQRPEFEPAARLRAVARGEQNPFLESRPQHEGCNHR